MKKWFKKIGQSFLRKDEAKEKEATPTVEQKEIKELTYSSLLKLNKTWLKIIIIKILRSKLSYQQTNRALLNL